MPRPPITDEQLAAGLRRWGRGMYPSEAAAELLVRHRSLARVCWDNGMAGLPDGDAELNLERPFVWFDPELVADRIDTLGLSSTQYRILLLAASLAGGKPVDLNECLTSMDRENAALIVATISHAMGTQEHGHPLTGERFGPLVPWTVVDLEHMRENTTTASIVAMAERQRAAGVDGNRPVVQHDPTAGRPLPAPAEEDPEGSR